MPSIYKTEAGGEAVRARYRQFLAHWPGGETQTRVPTSQGETFVISSGPKDAPAVVLLHGSTANAASWVGDAAVLGRNFRVHAIDMIGEPGFSAPSRPPLVSGVYAPWLGEVLDGLGLQQAALVGISLGGWLALQFATERPERVSALGLLCPGGIGRQKNILIWALPLLMLGPWGRRKVTERILGRPAAGEPPPETKAFGEFMQLIFTHFRPRTEKLPPVTTAALGRLSMPVLAILGAKDVMIDSGGTREALLQAVPHVRVDWLAEDGHMLMGHGGAIDAFLVEALRP
jgi:pimeloyl-ACP methyl ester carboxylesterase